MPKIIQLPPHIVAKIAAGEVIERPAFAVKELIENAIDAKATEIIISIEGAGLKKISVIDNGEGMSKEDLVNSIQLHTTSKIDPNEDLIGITSLGFRGEALATIAAISNVTIKSRRAEDTSGAQIKIVGGKLHDIKPIGMPIGTTVLVEQLFEKVPARKKFLKTKRTELREIIDVVTHAALAYSEIRFTFSHNNKLLFDLISINNIYDRLQALLGQDFAKELVPLHYEDSYVKISGFLGLPQISTPGQKQFIFINHRPVQNKLISTAVKESYGNLLDIQTYPVFVLSIDIPFETVDVNVHPRKEQVHFVDNTMIFQAVSTAVQQTLAKHNITFSNNSFISSIGKGDTNSYAGLLLKDEVLTSPDAKNKPSISQLHATYIVIQTNQGISIIDQHAAHERILFEKLSSAFKKEREVYKPIALKKSVIIECSFADAQLLEEYQDILHTLGFSIEYLHQNTFVVTQMPKLLQDRDVKTLIEEVLENLKEGKNPKAIDKQSQQMIAYLACRAAVKAGDTLSLETMNDILKQLETTPNNNTCPHGRPTHIDFPIRSIHRMFKRI